MKDIEKIYKTNRAKPEESLYDHTNLVLKQLDIIKRNGYIDTSIHGKNIEKLIFLACLYHDVGKINKNFQERVKSDKKRIFNIEKEIGHNILSAYLTMHLIEDKKHNDLTAKEKSIVINAILNHHHYVNNYDSLKNDKNKIEEVLTEIVETYSIFQKLTFDDMDIRRIQNLKALRDNKRYIFVKGLLHKCDYSASAHLEAEIANDFLVAGMDSKGFKWNPLQEYCRDKRRENLVVIGSTGIGKTEASLLWAGDCKTFYVLPLKTAINAMYERVKKDFVSQDYDKKIGLLHGETASQYLNGGKYREINIEEENEKFYKYYDLTKNMSLPLTISTPDQIFNFVFKYNGYELKLATLAYSKIIIDEIQAYSSDILAYTIHAISEISRHGGKFAIFTATLAPFVRDLLVKSLADISFKENVFLTEEIRHKIKVNDSRITSEYVCNFVVEKRGEKKTYLVVMNTVRDAQEIYREIKDKIGDEADIKLIHSRFTVEDRATKEKEILEDGNYKNFKVNNTKSVIWVSTQVVEASLDIDFDYLFTELSELLSLFQRMGRVFRKRSVGNGDFNVFVFTEIRDYLLKSDDKKGFIDRGLYELSKEALCEQGDGEISELEKKEMIDKYFTTEKLEEKEKQNRSCFLMEYRNNYNYVKDLNIGSLNPVEVEKKFRNIVSFKAIPVSFVYGDKQMEINAIIEELDILSEKIRVARDEKIKRKLRIDILRTKEKFNQYTLSVNSSYLAGSCDFVEYKYDKVKIIQHKYDSDLGLQREKDNFGRETMIW